MKVLQQKIAKVNANGDLNVQLILNEPKAFAGPIARYGKFYGVSDYLVMAGRKADNPEKRLDIMVNYWYYLLKRWVSTAVG